MEFETVQFFEYNIRSTVIDNVRMYLVADLLNQYNGEHGVNKRFRNYLKNEQTNRLLTKKREILGGSNSNSLENTESKYWNINKTNRPKNYYKTGRNTLEVGIPTSSINRARNIRNGILME